jgi:type IV secretory pathway component VirB8
MIGIMILLMAILIVLMIGIVTSLINNKPKCDHYWVDFDDGTSKCKICNKTIYLTSKDNNADLA